MFEVGNSKQAEFLAHIRDVGMQIVFGTFNKAQLTVFVPYCEYMDDVDAVIFLTVLKDFANSEEQFTPDDLLLTFGKFVPKIEYEDNEELCFFINEDIDCE